MKKIILLFVALVSLFATDATAQPNALLPKPAVAQFGDEIYQLPSSAAISYEDDALLPAANYLAEQLRRATGFKLPIKKRPAHIQLYLTDAGKKGSYALRVSNKGVIINGNGYAGVINGIATLRQLLPADIEKKDVQKGYHWLLPYTTIVDEPRFDWRGMELDCSRHFFSKEEVKELLDVLALYKINKFHWHLTDDQGWRVEIKKYPLLTANGGWRTFNNQDSTCLRRADEEKNADLLLPADKMRTNEKGEKVYGGFYTQDDIREIVAYAAQRGIDIVPEVDVPGHSLCAINNYEGLSCFEKTGWGELFTTPLCPGKDRVLDFVKDVYTEIFQLFPYEYVMLGADEVDQSNWEKCPDCQKRMKEHGLQNTHQLQAWFVHEMENFFTQHQRRMIGWDEIIAGGLSKTATVMWWRSWNPTAMKDATSHGNQVICTPNNEFYLDYSDDGNRLRSIYDFDAQPASLTEQERELVLGVQGNLWAEWLPTRERMYYQAFPRMLAVAELGWNTEKRDWDNFHHRLMLQLPRLQTLGVTYRNPDLKGFYRTNAFTQQTEVNITCDDPSALIRYTTDGTVPTAESTLYNGPFTLDHSAKFKFRVFDKWNRGGETFSADYIKEDYAPCEEIIGVEPGLDAAWYDFPGIRCADIETAPLNGHYIIDEVKIPQEAKGNIGLIITGYIHVTADDVYTFQLMSDDGSYLTIDGQMVVDNDGEHSPVELTGQHAMKSGQHKMVVRYFDHNGGQLRLRVLNSKGEPARVWFFH